MQMDERSSGRRRRSEEVGRQYIDNNPARRRRRSTVASGKICKLHSLLLLLLRVDHYSNLVALAFRKRYKPVDNPPNSVPGWCEIVSLRRSPIDCELAQTINAKLHTMSIAHPNKWRPQNNRLILRSQKLNATLHELYIRAQSWGM